MLKFWKSFFLTSRFYQILGILFLALIIGYFFKPVMQASLIALGVIVLLTILDTIQMYGNRTPNLVEATRITPERFSNGDLNDVTIRIKNNYPFSISIIIIDELPFQFQKRDLSYQTSLNAGEEKNMHYNLRPVERGEYHFGTVNVLTKSRLKLVIRRFQPEAASVVKVYPSFIQMRKFELLAISDRLSEAGIKKIRKIGHQMEFDQIRDYIKGDDYRTINWKATARKTHLMVNQYQDEKSQQVIALVDMGRTMKMPFEGMTLLDYAINTTLVISNIAMLKHDKAGVLTFNNKVRTQIPPQRHKLHLQTIMECLYNQQTGFAEHDLTAVYGMVRRHIHHRSLLMLFTNFESLNSAKREMVILKKLAKDHLVVVVFFENTEIKSLTETITETTEQIYIKAIAEKFIYDKKLIVRELENNGIHAVLTEPGKLTVNTINKYLELKARGAL
jgi:uncharacterized protein (DUF58 family)